MLISSVQQSDSVIHIYYFSYSFPLQFITGYWIQFPVLYTRFLLLIHPTYTSLYLLIPNSQSSPRPSHLGNHSLLSVSLFLFHKYVHLCCISTCKWYHTVFVFLFWHTSFSMIIFRSIHVAENDIISLFLFSYHCVIRQYHIHSRLF